MEEEPKWKRTIVILSVSYCFTLSNIFSLLKQVGGNQVMVAILIQVLYTFHYSPHRHFTWYPNTCASSLVIMGGGSGQSCQEAEEVSKAEAGEEEKSIKTDEQNDGDKDGLENFQSDIGFCDNHAR